MKNPYAILILIFFVADLGVSLALAQSDPGMASPTNVMSQPEVRGMEPVKQEWAQERTFESDYGGLYKKPEEMERFYSEFDELAAPDMMPVRTVKLGSKIAVTDRISQEEIVAGMTVERISRYFTPEELSMYCPDSEKITGLIMEFLDDNPYMLEDICWPVEDRLEDCELEKEFCEDIKAPKTHWGMKFSCPPNEEDIVQECISHGEERIREEVRRFKDEVPGMCEMEWVMNEPMFTRMCEEKCDERRFMEECERQLRRIEEVPQPPPEAWAPEPVEEPRIIEPGEPVVEEPKIIKPTEPVSGTQPEKPPIEEATATGVAYPTGAVIAAGGDCQQQLENFREMCRNVVEKEDKMCNKEAYIEDCIERNEGHFDADRMLEETKEMCKREAKRNVVALSRVCRQMEHDYKECIGITTRECEFAEEQVRLCNAMMTREKIKEKVSKKANEFCKFEKYRAEIEINKIEPMAGKIPVTVAVGIDTTENELDELKAVAGEVSESHRVGNVKVYKAVVDADEYDELEKLEFVLDSKRYEFAAGGEGIGDAVSALEASKEQVPDDFKVWINHEESNLIDVDENVEELTKTKDKFYQLKKVIGLMRKQELKDAEGLGKQCEKIEESIESLEEISDQVEDVSVKVLLQEQVKLLESQKESLEEMAESKKKGAAGIFSLFGRPG